MEQHMSATYVIASQKSWNAELANRLMKKTNHRFITISQNSDLTFDHLEKINPEKIFFTHWSTKIPNVIWEYYESIIFHMTDVPYGRGGSPLQNLILRGHKNTMISALRCVEALDAGPVYLKYPLSLSGTAQEIFYRADGVIEKMIIDIINNHPEPKPQIGEPVLFKRRKPEESDLLQAKSLSEMFDMIRMLDAESYPSAFLNIGNFRLEFKKAEQNTDYVNAEVVIREIVEGEAP